MTFEKAFELAEKSYPDSLFEVVQLSKRLMKLTPDWIFKGNQISVTVNFDGTVTKN